jgi:hypothetical protein
MSPRYVIVLDGTMDLLLIIYVLRWENNKNKKREKGKAIYKKYLKRTVKKLRL